MTPEMPSIDNGDLPEPPRLRQLRRLVTTLMIVLILGVVTIVGVLVIRLAQTGAIAALPDQIILPDGFVTTATTVSDDMILLVGRSGEIEQSLLVYDRSTGALLQTIPLQQE